MDMFSFIRLCPYSFTKQSRRSWICQIINGIIDEYKYSTLKMMIIFKIILKTVNFVKKYYNIYDPQKPVHRQMVTNLGF